MSMHIENNITSWSPSYMVPSRHKGRIGYSPQGCEEKDSSLLQRKLKVSDVEAIIELIQNFKCLMLMKAKKCEKCPLQFMQLCVQHNKCISFTSVSSCQLQQLPSISLSKFISSWAREVQTIPLALPCGSIYPSTNLSGSETLISNACKSTVPSGGLVLKTPGAHYTNMLVATCTKLHNGSIYNVLSRQGIAKWPTHTHTHTSKGTPWNYCLVVDPPVCFAWPVSAKENRESCRSKNSIPSSPRINGTWGMQRKAQCANE